MHAYRTRQYDVCLLLAAPDAPRIWEYAVWQRLVPALTPLLSSDRGRTSVRMTQFDQTQTGSPNQTYVRFGQIGWNEKSHRRWTHASPDTEAVSRAWEFCGAAGWAPGPSKCSECPPDGFLAVRNALDDGQAPGDCRFAYSVLLAAAIDRPDATQSLNGAIAALGITIPHVLLAGTRRTWSEGGMSLTDCDTFGAPFKPGPKHSAAPTLDMLEGNWQALTV
ncbi:MAG: hypothetical protein ABN482_02835 [Corticimicrobacter sp.]|uniref:hypothetical protein n=1 Tax=Corticimicrobacter sp. TaxID=2678536 RepID=UPI0032DA4403